MGSDRRADQKSSVPCQTADYSPWPARSSLVEASRTAFGFEIRWWLSIHCPYAAHCLGSCHPQGLDELAGKNAGRVALTLASWSLGSSPELAWTRLLTASWGF